MPMPCFIVYWKHQKYTPICSSISISGSKQNIFDHSSFPNLKFQQATKQILTLLSLDHTDKLRALGAHPRLGKMAAATAPYAGERQLFLRTEESIPAYQQELHYYCTQVDKAPSLIN
jgi:hypothetical protein